MNIKKEMTYEYEILRAVFLEKCMTMSDSEFNYTLGVLNTLAGYSDNLKDYVDLLRQTENKIMAR